MCGGGGMNETLNKIDPLGGYIAQRDPVGNMLEDAYQAGNWGEPYGQQKSGWDVLGAGLTGKAGLTGSADEPRDRAYGRAFGTAAAFQGAAAGAGAAAGGAGAGEGAAAGEAGAEAGGAGLGGGLSGSTTSGSGMEEMGGGQGLQTGAAAGTAEMGGGSGLVAPAGTEFAGGTTGTAIGAGGAILSAAEAAPMFNMSPETASALGINSASGSGGLQGGAGDDQLGSGLKTNASSPSGSADDPTTKPKPDNKIMGLKPQTAALLGMSAIQSMSKPKQTSADRSLETNATPAAQQASAVISSGGTGTPAWASQKDSIDATIDQQIQEQAQAIIQQAVNAGQGGDSMVVKQQVAQLKDKLETQRQTLYAQQQQKNVQAALQELGISNQALSNVSANQYNSSQQAKQQASQTASLALLLQALG